MNYTSSNFILERLPDNEQVYISLLKGVVSSVDDFSDFHMAKYSDKYLCRITLSDVTLTNSLISQLNDLHNCMGILLDYGKSIKKGNIFFNIPF